jgi:hypothetical protein
MKGLWRGWMVAWCWGVAVFGIVLIGAGFPETDAPTRALVSFMNEGAPFEIDRPLRFGIGIQGALSLGLALLMMAAVRASDGMGPGRGAIWGYAVTAMVAWFVTDSVISIANGFSLNAVSNTVLLLGFLAPVLGSGVLRQRAVPA